MKRPDVESILAPLKPFQRRTVEHAFERLFLAPYHTGRFLVADEVGLGKTLVARGIIARTIEHLWDDVERIDIVYICSNQSIARANLPKLKVTGDAERSFALATRLTMLATELAPGPESPGLLNSKVNFVSFTPSTSFDMGHSGGQRRERRVLFHLLEPIVERRTGLMNLLQAGVKRTDRWRWRLNHQPLPLEPGIAKTFRKALRDNRRLRRDVDEAIETWFGRHRERYPLEATRLRNRILGELRQLLATICIDALQPDLVILNEFQRFKALLEHRESESDPAAELAQALFHAQTPEGEPVRTLLLSATPYKLYTADAEIEHEDHYRLPRDGRLPAAQRRRSCRCAEARPRALRPRAARRGGRPRRYGVGSEDPRRAHAPLRLPPTVPYCPLGGAFDGQHGRTKSLLFSAWNVVLDVVSAVINYEAERRMVGGQMASYLARDQQQRPLLRLTRAADASLSRHRLLLLLLPCVTLADAAHPLAAPAGTDRRDWGRGQVEKLLADPRLPNVQDGPVDERWEWAIPLFPDPAMRAFLETWRDADPK